MSYQSRRKLLKRLAMLLGGAIVGTRSQPLSANITPRMESAYLGQIALVAHSFVMSGCYRCNGALIAVNTHQALFSLLGTRFGGNGLTTFALPNLNAYEPPNMQYIIYYVGYYPSNTGPGYAVTASPTASLTPSQTNTVLTTPTNTSTHTAAPTNTSTHTAIPTNTSTHTAAPTNTPSNTASHTPTSSVTSTPTATPTTTHSPIATTTALLSKTPTNTLTANQKTATVAVARTRTALARTRTALARTPSRTFTRTSTRTNTRVPSRTFTRVPTRTFTRVPTRTPVRRIGPSTPSTWWLAYIDSDGQ